MTHQIIDDHPAVKAVDDHLARLDTELKTKDEVIRREHERYRVALETAVTNGLPLPDPPETDLGRLQDEFRRRREVLLRQRDQAITEHAEELLGEIKAEHDALMAQLRPATELLSSAGPKLLDLVRAGIEVTRGTALGASVPRWCGDSRTLRKIGIEEILRAVAEERGFIGDPVLEPTDYIGRRSA